MVSPALDKKISSISKPSPSSSSTDAPLSQSAVACLFFLSRGVVLFQRGHYIRIWNQDTTNGLRVAPKLVSLIVWVLPVGIQISSNWVRSHAIQVLRTPMQVPHVHRFLGGLFELEDIVNRTAGRSTTGRSVRFVRVVSLCAGDLVPVLPRRTTAGGLCPCRSSRCETSATSVTGSCSNSCESSLLCLFTLGVCVEDHRQWQHPLQ